MTIPIGIMVTVSDIILGFQFCRTPAPGVQAWDALWDSDCRQIFRPGWVCAPFKCSQSLTPLSLNIIFTFPTSRRSKLLNTTITMLTLYLSPPLKGSTGSWKVGGVDAWGETYGGCAFDISCNLAYMDFFVDFWNHPEKPILKGENTSYAYRGDSSRPKRSLYTAKGSIILPSYRYPYFLLLESPCPFVRWWILRFHPI